MDTANTPITPATTDEELQLLRSMATSLDCFLDEDLCLLADVKPDTLQEWRKRGKAPRYCYLGNRALTFRAGLREILELKMREPRAANETARKAAVKAAL